ncbi:MAG: primase-helicase family protein [Terracidiphilus sp.]
MKVGIDDFIVANGAKKLRALIDGTKEEDKASEFLHDLFERFLYVIQASYILETATGNRFTVAQFAGELTANRIVEVGEHKMTAGRAFMQSAMRPEVKREVYVPGAPQFVDGCFNRWTGWGVEPTPGDVKPFLKLVELLVPAAVREWFLDWLAYPLQHPGAKLMTAVGLIAEPGTGKNTLAEEILCKVYGVENSIVIDQNALDSEFNAPLACRQLIIGDEITTSGRDARHRSDIVKRLVTGKTVVVNKKFEPQVVFPNNANYLFLTNHQDAFHLEENDRRFAVIESPNPPCSAEFYDKIFAWLDDGGAAHLFHFLLHRDLNKFNPHAHAPKTEARENAVAASRSVLAGWVHDLRDDPDSVVINERSPFQRVLSLHTADELLCMFDGKQGRYSVKAMTLALRAAGFELAYKGGDGQVNITTDTRRRLWAARDARRIHGLNHDKIAALYRRERPHKNYAASEGGR